MVLQFCDAMRGLAEHWWWSPADNNAEQGKFCRTEPKQKMKVGSFRLRQVLSVACPEHLSAGRTKPRGHEVASNGMSVGSDVCWIQQASQGTLK